VCAAADIITALRDIKSNTHDIFKNTLNLELLATFRVKNISPLPHLLSKCLDLGERVTGSFVLSTYQLLLG
jgi:hypothetical protein